MVISLVESDLITFYEIYECFDRVEIFNSNWENQVSNKLIDININVQGSIDQIPSETSAKTVQAIKDVVNQILPGEISKRLGALKA